MIEQETLCCAGARLTGHILTGRDKGGAVWTLNLAQVTRATYAQAPRHGAMTHTLRLRGPEGWRQVAVSVPRERMAISRDALEHRALTARVAEVLADLHPGFRIEYQVGQRQTQGVLAGVAVAVMALVMVAAMGVLLNVPVPVTGVLLMGGALALAGVALAVLRAGVARRAPSISATALPGILTAHARRSD